MTARTKATTAPTAETPTVRNDQAVIDVAQQAVRGHELAPGVETAFVLPAGSSLASVDLDTDEHRGHPRRVKGTTVVRSEESLVALAEKWGNAPSTLVYADAVTRSVVAVLNDDVDADDPGFRDRRVELKLVHTPEWQRWAANDGVLMDQHTFAEFLESSLADVRKPDAAELLEVAQTLEATTQVSFRSQVRLTSGSRQFLYSEEGSAAAGRGGELEVPTEFLLGLRAWSGRGATSEPFGITAKLRYRVTPQGLKLGYKLIDVDRVLDRAFAEDVVEPIREAGLTVVNGTP